MKQSARIAALALALCMLAGELAACNKQPAGTDTTPESTVVISETDVPATAAETDVPAVTDEPATAEITPEPTEIVTEVPGTDEPASAGTEEPSLTPEVTEEPTGTPVPTQTAETKTSVPTGTPTPTQKPTATPTKAPTATPTAAPTLAPNPSEEEIARANELLAAAAEVAPTVSNEALTAANEDSSITLWFTHSYYNTPAEEITSNGLNTYQIRLAKNEIEGCHLLLASSSNKEDLELVVSDFTNASGDVLEKEVCYGWYFDDVAGQTVADPIPVLEHEFDLTANKSQMFIIKVKSKTDTPAGQYTATVTLKDANGNELKKANVYAYVWNFALPIASTCKTLSDLNEWSVIVGANREETTQDGLEDDLYALYYEYLLENKINCYTLPYAKRGGFWDDRVEQYLDDPRMTAYTLMWKVGINAQYGFDAFVQAAYDRVSKKQEWLDKAYFYPDADDEPLTTTALNQIRSHHAAIAKVFGNDFNMIIPMHYNTALNTANTMDFFEFVKSAVNVWCPHTYFFNTYAEKLANPDLMFQFYSKKLEDNLGVFKDRMAAQQAEGDEVWWYVTRYPHNPEITLSIDDESVKHRLLFWQQKLYNVDGFLYYMVNEWEDAKNWTKKYEHAVGTTVVDTYGNGVLIYPGGALQEYIDKYGSDGYPGPIGSLRLESVRDGVEDYDYFTLLDNLYGEGSADAIIKQYTTSLGEYSTDVELFNTLRVAVGNLIAAKQG